jgi:hypothetical protein
MAGRSITRGDQTAPGLFVADLADDVLDLRPVLADYTDKRGYPPTTRG